MLLLTLLEAHSCSVGYVVLTSVDRDDLPDGGSEHFARTVRTLKVGWPDGSLQTRTCLEACITMLPKGEFFGTVTLFQAHSEQLT
jgi:hypothetical protein